MPPSTVETTAALTVALIGNPNTGKSTLFNALSGYQALTGNYPGVTVEKKIGRMRCGDRTVNLVDLPGTYSLSPRSLDEMVAVNVLLGRQADVAAPDVVVCIVDASNIERNLYLVSQVLDVGLPVVLVLNMVDVARSRGMTVDVAALSQRLGLPVIATEAHRRRGIDDLRQAILAAAAGAGGPRPSLFPPAFLSECAQLETRLSASGQTGTPPYLLERYLLDVGGYLETRTGNGAGSQVADYLKAARIRLAEQGCKVPAIEARVRYQWAREMLAGVVAKPAVRPVTASDRLDRFLTHRFAGLAVFVAIMFLIFQAISTGAEYLMAYCEAGQAWVKSLVEGVVPPGPLQSLLTDGVVAGVGGVLIFLPQIVILFLFIALLEDCGYMARAAFVMDKLMTRVGLSGKSFVPLMSSFACAIPGVMATRVIENRRDRMTTILVAPLMSCSARQPVYLLMIVAFIPATAYLGGWVKLHSLVLLAMTALGAVVAVPVAWLFKKTLFKGETPPFVMELPSYKWPSPWIVVQRVYDQGKAFVVRAGTLIFATTILVWGASYFPVSHAEAERVQVEIEQTRTAFSAELNERDELTARAEALEGAADTDPESQPPGDVAQDGAGVQARLAALDVRLLPLTRLIDQRNQENERLLEQSFLGRFGQAIEPLVKPLGWDWKIGVGVIASFPAREVIISTLGTIYSLGGEVDEEDQGLQAAVRASTWPDGRPVYSIPVAFSIMVFFALCAQCASTLMIIKRETNSWRWPLFTFTYMTVLAYIAAFVAYRAALVFA